MGASRFIMSKNSHFGFVFWFRNMFRVVNSFWVFLFKFIGSFSRLPNKRNLEDLDRSFDEFNERHGNDHVVDQGNREGESSAMAASSSKYEFLYGKSISGFIEEPKTESFTVNELYMGSNDTAYFNGGILDSRDSVGADYGKIEVDMEDVFEDKPEECALRFSFEKIFDFEKHIKAIQEEQPVQDYVGDSVVERATLQTEQDIKDVVGEKTGESVENSIAEVETEDKFEETAEESVENCITKRILEKQAGDLEGNQHVAEKQTRYEEDLSIETESMVSPDKTKGQNMQEDEENSEFGSEHDDGLLERLKMEVKIARTGGLPTILEDFESPKMMLGPLQINEKYDHKVHIAEIQKVYKSYFHKIRKLDILNSQTMHAISLLQLKNAPIQLSTPAKSSAPAYKSLHKALSFRQRRAEGDPTKKLLRDLYKDLETIYVGQICLSWTILHWQFGQVKKLLACDTPGVHRYNLVASEFQHFQVLLQRFLEDEPFRTRSRVENYVNYRCSVPRLLQVPVIKDDCSKYKEDAISSEMLIDVIEESMHVFWDFLRADKDEPNSTSKASFQSQVAPHDPIHFDLLMDVRADLQKKEKKLEEIQRG